MYEQTLYYISLATLDPFQTQSEGKDNLVHVRIQQRNGRKTLTTVQGISQDYDLKKIVKVCKKVIIKISFISSIHL